MSGEISNNARSDHHRFLELEENISDSVTAVDLGMLAIKDETSDLLRFGFQQVKAQAAALRKKYYDFSKE
jgi:hypothetical protein